MGGSSISETADYLNKIMIIARREKLKSFTEKIIEKTLTLTLLAGS